jgi:protein-S-isoprenylcysteine O-methyltransferase Ste14
MAPAQGTREMPRRRPLLRHPFRRKTIAPRTLAIYAVGVAALWFARPEPALFAAGLVLVTAGQALRLWATGFLLKTDELTLAGPYAHLRHPLYLGALLVGCGFALMSGPNVARLVLPLGMAFFFGYYLRYKERVESERLGALYGDEFRAYRAAVRPLWPRRRPWHPRPPGEPVRWRLDRVLENDEQTALAYVIAATVALAALGWLRSG